MPDLLRFFLLTDSNVRFVVLGSMLLAASSAVVGCFTLLRKRALVGDAVAHAVLPGVCLAFMLSGSKNPLLLLGGAFVTGWLSVMAVDLITSRTRIKEDSALGLVLSVFFGLGILLLTSIQHQGNASQTGLDRFLFGKAAALVGADLWVFGIVAVLLLLAVWVFYKEFKLISFDEAFAQSIGLPVKLLRTLLTTLTVLAVVVGIQAVGVVLMAAMLITPAAAARFWTNRLGIMLVLAAGLGAAAGYAGAFISYLAPSMPTGPWMVVVASTLAMGSFMLAPKTGLLARMLRQRAYQSRMTRENILKAFYHLSERDKLPFKERGREDLQELRHFPKKQLQRGLKQLINQGYLAKSGLQYALTPEGKTQGQRVVRLHRLWELYLSRHLHLAPDHVHEDAESIEHVLTPELEEKLQAILDYPELDPHNEQIPYQ